MKENKQLVADIQETFKDIEKRRGMVEAIGEYFINLYSQDNSVDNLIKKLDKHKKGD